MPLELVHASAMVLALVLYAVMAGADFGGGVWDLLASGPSAARQRALVAEAIAPIWEANHVWMILVVVILFSAFPPAFAAIATALHVPIAVLLVGIVLRGSAFAFQSLQPEGSGRGFPSPGGSHETHEGAAADGGPWRRVFALSSVVSPFFLGVIVGAIGSGRVRLEGGVPAGGFFAPWIAPYPFAVGAFAVALFAFLAAVYLAAEAKDPDLQEELRRRALAAGVLVGALALAVFLLAREGAPHIFERLSRSAWTWDLQIATAGFALGAFAALLLRRHAIARWLAAGQVALIVLGWALAQYPYLLVPDITIAAAAAPEPTLQALLAAIVAGGALVVPGFAYLYKVFKGG